MLTNLTASSPSQVIRNIQQRAANRRAGTSIDDNRKIALVIEGGGMRAVYSAAGATALAQLGYSGLFDEVYATSAGVMNASYFIANQALLGMSVYFENCATRNFFNPARFWKVIDVDYIVDKVAAVEKRLDVDAVKRSVTRLLVAACDYRTGAPLLIDTQTTETPIWEVFRAAMAIPVFYNRTVQVDGRACVDCGTILPFPLTDAINRGCTDILVLLTRPSSFEERSPPLGMKLTFNVVHSRFKRTLSHAFAHRRESAQRVRELALGRIAPPPGVNIMAAFPDESDAVQSTTTQQDIVYPAALRYGKKVLELFGHDPDILVLR
ncbi:MAG: patatin-like phospholipase family protein [Pirellulaceae bacterium]|nr:patatin-like phospholipase family protein [Pirellulaceae bacterium]